jgi:putative intracellular protease/amidase
VIDDDDMAEFDYAFLNDPIAQKKAQNTLAMKDVNPSEYEAIYLVGGKGAMFDFPNNKYIQQTVRELYESGKTVAAICHGPAALVNVKLSDGSALIANKTVSSFTNDEEFYLIPNAEEIFPFLLESKLREQEANIILG